MVRKLLFLYRDLENGKQEVRTGYDVFLPSIFYILWSNVRMSNEWKVK